MTKFCTQCGAQVDETARFCKKCGTSLLPTQPAAPDYQQPPNFDPGFVQNPGQVPYQAPYQAPATHADLKPNVAGMLCYPLSFITGVLFLVLTPYNRDRFVRFHAWQSIFFVAALLVASVGGQILLPRFLEWLFLSALQLVALAGTGWSMYKAYNGEQSKLPLIGEWAEKQASKNMA